LESAANPQVLARSPSPTAALSSRTVEKKLNADPGFTVRFLQSGSLFSDEAIVADMQTEILDHLHAVIELDVDKGGVARWRLSKNNLGPKQDWKLIHQNIAIRYIHRLIKISEVRQ
jgi:hypothetical protein